MIETAFFSSDRITSHTVHQRPGGLQWRYEFDNGYGASVVCHDLSYGGPEGFFEVAVTLAATGECCYSTPITGDVLGWRRATEVCDLLRSVAALPNI